MSNSNGNGRICDLLSTLPPNFAIDNVIVFGLEQATTNFINIDRGLAFFRNGAETKVFDCNHIDGLDLN